MPPAEARAYADADAARVAFDTLIHDMLMSYRAGRH